MNDLEILFGTASQTPPQSEKPSATTPKPESTPSSRKKTTPQSTKVTPLPQVAEKTTKPQNRLSTNQSATPDVAEKVEKYTTHIFPSLVKKVKLRALEQDINDYDIVNNALTFYFDKNK